MKTIAEEMRETLDLLELQPGWSYGKFDSVEGFSDEFIAALKLYSIEAHGQWHGQNTPEAASIDKAFQAEMPVMGRSLNVFRGWAPNSMDDVADESNFLKSETISFPWYMSASTDLGEALYYLENSGSVMIDSPQIVFDIETMASARGIVVSDFYTKHRELDWLENWSGEVIFDKHAKFDVVWKTDRNTEEGLDDLKHMRDNGLIVWEVQLRQVG